MNQDVVAGFIAGEKEAFKKVYEGTKQTIYSVIYRMVGNAHDAEDVMHDVYIRVFEKRRSYQQEKAALPTWLYRIAVNFTLNFLKKRKRWSEHSPVEEVSQDILEKHAEQAEYRLALSILDKINPDFKICLVLRELEDKSYKEIAKILKISEGTVRSRINRGRKELKKIFEKEVQR